MFIALRVLEIIGGTPKIWAVPGYCSGYSNNSIAVSSNKMILIIKILKISVKYIDRYFDKYLSKMPDRDKNYDFLKYRYSSPMNIWVSASRSN